MENILNFEEFSLNEAKKQQRKNNLSDVEYVSGGVKYKNEIFPGVNSPKRYVGKSKHKYRVLAKEGNKVKPINFGDKTKKTEERISKLSKKYWENLPIYK